MLDLEALFNKRPFIYYVDDEYYAFGQWVCTKCNEYSNYTTLQSRYDNYLAVKDKDISQDEAWNVYRRVASIAEITESIETKSALIRKFEEYNFSEDEKAEIEKQLLEFVKFFHDNRLSEYC